MVAVREDIDNMRRRLLISTLICLLGFSAFFAVRINNVRAADAEEDTGYSQIAVFARAVQLIRQDYVDGNKTSYHGLNLCRAERDALVARSAQPVHGSERLQGHAG